MISSNISKKNKANSKIQCNNSIDVTFKIEYNLKNTLTFGRFDRNEVLFDLNTTFRLDKITEND